MPSRLRIFLFGIASLLLASVAQQAPLAIPQAGAASTSETPPSSDALASDEGEAEPVQKQYIETEKFCERLSVGAGEQSEGDRYIAGQSITVAGTHRGDIAGIVQSVNITGEVTGDLILWAQSVNISGTVRDSIRVFGNNLTISGEIEGDVIFFGYTMDIMSTAVIHGDVTSINGVTTLQGELKRDLFFTGGQIEINADIAGNAKIKADAISFQPTAKIGGDLTYTSRTKLDDSAQAFIDGEIFFEEKEEKPAAASTPQSFFGFSFFFKVLWIIAMILISWIGVALFRRGLPAVRGAIESEPVMTTLVGFGAFLVLPAASLVLIWLLPLGLSGLFLFALIIMLGKLPVALWCGRKILERLGREDPSPYLSIALGVLLLYALFLIPYLGWLIWGAVTCLGLGALLMATKGSRGDLSNAPQKAEAAN